MSQNILITGSGGLVGSEAVHFFCQKDFKVYGIDNDMRAYYFGKDGSTSPRMDTLRKIYKNYKHYDIDIRDKDGVEDIFKARKYSLILHAAAQPSHDWAATEPFTDFGVNADGTLVLLENFRRYSPEGVFIFTSTNKVYGDTPNRLPLRELKTRYEIDPNHIYADGIEESMTIDNSTHSLFGVSKAAADLLVQEYGRYFNLHTGVFRGGCLTGSGHAGTEQHGFLSYLVKTILLENHYTVYGYKGKQVRDNIHSHDLIDAFFQFYQKPKIGEVYNIGGSRFANVSILEAIKKIEDISGRKAKYEISEDNRVGDHIWYVSSVKKFQQDFPGWKYNYDIDKTIEDICKNSSFSKDFRSYAVSKNLDYWRDKNWFFHKSLTDIFKDFVPENQKVLQIGYGLGDILAEIYPQKGVSVDVDEEIVNLSSRRHPSFSFYSKTPEEMSFGEKFNYVILPNSVDHFFDIQTVLEKAKKCLYKDGRLIITNTNPRWQLAFSVLEKFDLKRSEKDKNWLRLKDLANIVEISGLGIVDKGYRILVPYHVPFLTRWLNQLANIPGLAAFSTEQFIVARPLHKKRRKMTCTVVIPCFNEEENIEKCIKSVPKMGEYTEILVVDDGSLDNTSRVVKKLERKRKNLRLISYKPNRGKGWAVKRGMDEARGDVLMILDADMTVDPSELPRFFDIIASGQADFVNGTRLIYPMEEQAMRQLNLLGNLGFSWIFSWILSQHITDTLCGTKALLKTDYEKIHMSGKSWGDFDLLFGAAENNLKIVELPVHYKKRVAGESKMRAFKHGKVLAQKCVEGFWRLKVKSLIPNNGLLKAFSQS